MTDAPDRPHAARLFPGGGGQDDTDAARRWARNVLRTWGRADTAPVVDALITAARGRRPWWLALRHHGDAVHAQVLRARAARTPELPARVPGAERLSWTYGTARTPDSLCLWADVSAPG
ncbi:hypothetical protein [Streptomyces avicenniae]|uniref:hypothetical protein n=1 Tax=Streptomyces avicenniae TaxID=500153 RepID=UPI0006994A47|nr:hypothetical protein [Streptomyces avicenniae]